MHTAKLSVLWTSCLHPRQHPWYSFLLEAESISAKTIKWMKNPNGKWTHHFPAGCEAPKPNVPPSTSCYSSVLSQVSSYNIWSCPSEYQEVTWGNEGVTYTHSKLQHQAVLSSLLQIWPLYPHSKSPRYPLNRTVGGPHSQCGCIGEEKYLLSLSEIKPWSLECPAHGPVLVPIVLIPLLATIQHLANQHITRPPWTHWIVDNCLEQLPSLNCFIQLITTPWIPLNHYCVREQSTCLSWQHLHNINFSHNPVHIQETNQTSYNLMHTT